MKLGSFSEKLASFLRKRHLLLFFLILQLAFILHLAFATWIEYPGISDPTHYYVVAENLVEGRGFQVDYIWNYLSKPATITHSSNDYWVPLTSIVIAPFLWLFGQSIFAALIPSLLFGLALAVLTHALSKTYSESRFVAFYAAGLVFLVPWLFYFAVQTDTPIYYALFVSLGLFFMIKGSTDPRFFLPAAASAGLAHLTRMDGVLLVLTLLVVILLSPQNRRTKLIYVLLSLLLYLLVLSPWLISNMVTFGSPLPSAPSKTALMTDYREIAKYSEDLTLSRYLNWGLANMFWSKFGVLLYTIKTFYQLFGHLLWIFALIGIVDVLRRSEERRKWRRYLPPLLFLGLLFAFYILIATFPSEHGSFRKSAAAVVPFFVIWAVVAIERLITSKTVAIFVVLVLASILLFESAIFVGNSLGEDAQFARQLTQVKEILQDQGDQDIVVMTMYPWDVYYGTGYKAIQIPHDDLDTVVEVAQRYGAEYLLLPAERDPLIPIYEGRQSDERFVLIAPIPNSDWKLFRIEIQNR